MTAPAAGTLRELELRLAHEPDNVPLRVTVAGMLRDAGRGADAVEHYRAVAIAYRAQGRMQQASAVCRSILELAPDDIAIHALLAELAAHPRPSVPSPAGTRGAQRTPSAGTPAAPPRSSFETDTPLPRPVPYHLADPTSQRIPLQEPESVDEAIETRPGPRASAVDVAAELETRQRPRLSAEQIGRISDPPPTVPTEQVMLDEPGLPRRGSAPEWERGVVDEPGLPRRGSAPEWERGVVDEPGLPHDEPDTHDEDQTAPRTLPSDDPLANAFFVALPANRREAALARCTKREARAGTTVIRHGDTTHPLILVVRGELEVRADRANGTLARLETIDAGQYIGEAALLGRTPAAASVVAITDSELLALPAHALFELAGAYPALWAALKDSAERRSRQYDKLIRASP